MKWPRDDGDDSCSGYDLVRVQGASHAQTLTVQVASETSAACSRYCFQTVRRAAAHHRHMPIPGDSKNRVAPIEDTLNLPPSKLQHVCLPLSSEGSFDDGSSPNHQEASGPAFVHRQTAANVPLQNDPQKLISSDVYGIVSQEEQWDRTEDGVALNVMRQVSREEIGRKTAAPCNFHQATVFFNLVHQGSSSRLKRTMLILSSTLIWMQLISVLAFVYGVYNATCSRSSDCFIGQFCAPFSDLKQMMCHPCMQKWSAMCSADASVVASKDVALVLWEKSIWSEEHMKADTLQKMCMACVIDGSYLPGRSAAGGNVAKMSSADVFIFILCLALISLSVVNELRDIFLCNLCRLSDPAVAAAAQQRKKKELEPIPLAILSLMPSACSTWKLHWILLIHQCIRHYAILPVLIMSIPMLIVVQGSSGVSICLNSVGVLFVLEMDNLAYQYGVHEQKRETMEADGTMYLNESIHDSLTRMKNAHLISVPLGIIITLLLIRADITGPYHLQIVWMMVCSLSFWLCGLVEAFVFTKAQGMSMRLNIICFEVSKMAAGEIAIWCALCVLYPYFIPRFFSGSFW